MVIDGSKCWRSDPRLAAPDALAGFRLDGIGRRLGAIVLDRLADRSRIRVVNIGRRGNCGGRLIDVIRTIVVAAGESAAGGNEDSGGGKSDLGHFNYSSILMFCPSSGVPWEEFASLGLPRDGSAVLSFPVTTLCLKNL
ncbi:hypothetical protein MESS4_510035 [Mesorhizobium sp. STM 4661]|nr:hypothetical protein MESS4_510035 [Mesorhizobium sp. STM 4661]